jgi:DNA adenine methylase
MTNTKEEKNPRPFLKWVGGKTQLLPELGQFVEAAKPFNRYHEPFVGGGALFFYLHRQGLLNGGNSFLSDINPNLIEIYQAVRTNPDKVIQKLKQHAKKHSHDHYYAVRADVPKDAVARAARLIYLNKTCFNGLFRENSKGEFNVPMGRYVNPAICDADNLGSAALCLQKCDLETRHFSTVLEYAQKGDLVYFDPPYHPLTKTAYFTDYSKYAFTEESQWLLAQVFTRLANRGVKVMLSNSDTPLINKLYNDFHIHKVLARRNVNSNSEKRGKVSEVIVTLL